MDKDRLKKFVNRVLTIEPQYIDVFGNGVPGMAGRSASTSGAANAGADTVNHMRQVTVEFARAYVNPRLLNEDLDAHANLVEADLTVCVTLGVLAEAEANNLTDELHDLIAVR